MSVLTVKQFEESTHALGVIIDVCILCNAYLDWTFDDARRLFLPPIKLRQYAIFCENTSGPLGFCTWARIDELTAVKLKYYGCDLEETDWANGNAVWIIDCVALEGNVTKVYKYIRRVFFSDSERFFALRREQTNGTVRRIVDLKHRKGFDT